MLLNNRILFFFKNNHYKIVFTFGIAALSITVILVKLFIEPLHIIYLVVVSLLFSILITQILYEAGIKIIELNINTAIILFIFIYLLLSIWYCAVKAYPEYINIIEFRKKRVDLIYNIQKNAPPPASHLAYRRQLAELYMHADPAVEKLEPNVNLQGVSLMRVFLEEQMKEGKGREFKEYMYDLAEVAFTVASRDLAHEWYKLAYDYGVSKALDRYKERMDEYNKNSYR